MVREATGRRREDEAEEAPMSKFVSEAVRLPSGRLEWKCLFCGERHSVDPEKRGKWTGNLFYVGWTPCTHRKAFAGGLPHIQFLREVKA